MNFESSIIKDKNLTDIGNYKIDWVKDHMPLLNQLFVEFSNEQPFKGLRIAVSVHLEAKTAYLCEVLEAGGAQVFVTGSNTLSTQDDVAAALDSYSTNIYVYAIHDVPDVVYKEHLRLVLSCHPHIIIDDGGDLVNMLHTECTEYSDCVIGGCEETTTGILRLKAMSRSNTLKFPMIAVNDAKCKHLFDNRYGTGQSVWDSIMRNTNLVIAGKNVVVAGYGWCSKGIAKRAAALGAKVTVTEINPVCALEAYMDGYNVQPMDDACKFGDIFVTSTGCKDVITSQHILNMKSGSILCNAGHFNVEIDMEFLENHNHYKKLVRNNINRYYFSDNRYVDVIAEGKLVNIAAADGHPAEIMDMSFAVQALSAKYVVDTFKYIDNSEYSNVKDLLINLPDSIDLDIAYRKLRCENLEIDYLSSEQLEYLNSWNL